MVNEENAFVDVEIEEFSNDFKTNVYLKNIQDLKPYQGRDFHITNGVPTRSLYVPKGFPLSPCSSWDRVNGYQRVDKEKVLCADCMYASKKGVTLNGADGASVVFKCKTKYAIFMEHPESDKQYILSLNFSAQKNFGEYRKTLLKRELDVNQVITKITLVFDDSMKPAYTFEFVSELDLNMTDDEEAAINDIRTGMKDDGKSMSVNEFADFIISLAEIRELTMDKNRARRLAESVAKNGIIEVV